MPAHGLIGHVPGLASHGLVDESALTGALHAPPLPVGGLGISSLGLQTANGVVGFTRVLGVTVRGLDASTCVLQAATGPCVIVHGHSGPATDLVTVTSCFSPLTGLNHGIEVGGLGGVAGMAWRLLVPPGIVTTLGRGWCLPLRLRAAPPHGPRLLCRTSPSCSSACRGPVNSGMR